MTALAGSGVIARPASVKKGRAVGADRIINVACGAEPAGYASNKGDFRRAFRGLRQ